MRWLWLLLLLSACGQKPPDGSGSHGPVGPLTVHASVAPLADIAAAIGGEHATVHCLAREGADPRKKLPPRESLVALQSSDLVLFVGRGWETWSDLVALRPSAIVELAGAVGPRLIELESEVTHQHGPEGAHSHHEVAGQMWLDPTLAIALADVVRDAMIARRPKRADDFRKGHAALVAELKAADEALKGVTLPLAVTAGPGYRYAVRRYGWRVSEVAVDLSKAPTPDKARALRAAIGKGRWLLTPTAPADGWPIGQAKVVVLSTLELPAEQRLPARLHALAELLRRER